MNRHQAIALNRLDNYVTLFEVGEWKEPKRPVPPAHDPALLRHVAGDLWAVLAVWDLTELERMVLGITRR